MKRKTYTLTGVGTAIALLRPGASFRLGNTSFVEWEDPRPAPTWEEIQDTLKKLEEFEKSIPCIELEE